MTNFPTNCNTAASTNSCSQILYQLPQAAGNMTQNWQPGLPLTIEGTGFGYLPETTLPYAATGWAGLATSYLTITDTPSGGGTGWTSPNSPPLTDTSPFSLVASTSCAVNSGDSISVSVTNPQTNVSSTPHRH